MWTDKADMDRGYERCLTRLIENTASQSGLRTPVLINSCP